MKGRLLIFIIILAISIQPIIGTVSAEYNGDNNHIIDGTNNIVLIGQTLTFNDSDQDKMIIKKEASTEGRVVTNAFDGFDSLIFLEEGLYFIDSDPSTPGGYDSGETLLSVAYPKLSLKLKIGTLDITEAPFITIGDALTVEVSSNLDLQNDLVSLKVIRKSDDAEMIIDGAGQQLWDRNISYLNGLQFDTSNLVPGGYEFYIETKVSASQGLYLKSESIFIGDESPKQEDGMGEDTVTSAEEILHNETKSEMVVVSSDGVVTLKIPIDIEVDEAQFIALESLQIVPIELQNEDEIAAYSVTPKGLSVGANMVLEVDYREIVPRSTGKYNTVIKMYEKGEWVTVETRVNESSGILSADIDRLDDLMIFEEVGPVPSEVPEQEPVITTPPPATATPKEEPGFGAIITVTSLIAVAFTLMKLNRE